MQPILIVYATREGHTRRIAQRLADALRERGLESALYDARDDDKSPRVSEFSAAILAASLHLGRHEAEMRKFIEREREALERLPCAFLSVSMTEAEVEDETKPPERRAQAAKDLEKATNALFEQTKWHPARTQEVAGALMYTKYNLLVRWVMKSIARKQGASTDVSRDHVFTDWQALERFVDEFSASLRAAQTAGDANRAHAEEPAWAK